MRNTVRIHSSVFDRWVYVSILATTLRVISSVLVGILLPVQDVCQPKRLRHYRSL